MQFFRSSILSAGLLLGFSSVAAADGEWQTIQTAGDSSITMEIPAGVNQVSAVDPGKGELMAFFAAKSQGDETLECFLNRNAYSESMNQASWNDALASSKISILCENSGATISHYEADSSQSTTSNGYSAATCVGAYTDSREKLPGIVTSTLTVAAPDAIYTLTCDAGATDQDEAIAAWMVDWKDTVDHIQASLHLPAQTK
jgi:hypothetical protein